MSASYIAFVCCAILFVVVGLPWICTQLDDGPDPLAEDSKEAEDADFFL